MDRAAVSCWRGIHDVTLCYCCCPRDSNDTIHPNLTLPDPAPLNDDIDNILQEFEELLRKINQTRNHSDSGDVDGKEYVCLRLLSTLA